MELAKQQRLEAQNISKAPKATNAEPVQNKDKAPITSENIIKHDSVKLASIQSENAPANQVSQNVLPEKFFDQEKSANTDRDTEAEWVKFQREIKEADTISSIIVSEEQDSLNIKRHLKEIAAPADQNTDPVLTDRTHRKYVNCRANIAMPSLS